LKRLEKIQEVVLALFLILLPFVFSVRFTVSFEIPKVLIFRLFTALLLITVIWEFYLNKKVLKDYLNIFKKHKYLNLIFFLPIFQLISIILNESYFLSILGSDQRQQGFINLVFYILLFCVFIHLFRKRILRKRILSYITFSSFLVMFIGFLQYFESFPYLRTKLAYENIRIFSTLGQANVYAAFLILIIPFFFLLKTKFKYIFAVLAFISICLTLSRVALAVSIFELILLSLIEFKNRKRLFKYLALFLITACSSVFLIYGELINRFRNFETLKVREFLFDASITAIKTKPFWGFAYDNFRNYSATFINPEISKYEFSERVADRAHNIILDLLLSGGFSYLFIFILFFLGLLFYLKRKKMNKEELILLIGLFSIFLYLQLNFLTVVLTIYSILVLSYLLTVSFEYKNYKLEKVNSYFIPIASSILVFTISFITIFPLFSSDIFLKKYILNHDIRYLESSIRLNPYRSNSYLLKAKYYSNELKNSKLSRIDYNYKLAQDNLNDFLKCNGSIADYYLNLGTISRTRSIRLNEDLDESIVYLNKALFYYPYSAEIRGELAVTLFLNGEKKRADAEFEVFQEFLERGINKKILDLNKKLQSLSSKKQ
jgi:O-antigen ligase